MNRESLQKLFDGVTKSALIHEAVLIVENSVGDFSENFGYGERDINTPMLIASITKMFTTTCVLKLCEDGKLLLEDKLTQYFSDEQLKGLHVLNGHEYSFDLTISDLIFQTSGLPDDFEDGNVNSFLQNDFSMSFTNALASVKKQEPHFAPNTRGKAFYSNINFDLLGEIIMKVVDKSLVDIYEDFIISPLELTHTYLVDENDFVPHCYYGNQKLERPKAIASSGASGGCVSTPKDLLNFSKGFWTGRLFNKAILKRLAVYKGVQSNKGPIKYGGGYMQIPLGGLLTPFMGKGELIGHSGSTGSFMFYYPEKDLHFVGDLTQFKNPALPIRFVIKLAMMAK